MFMCLFPDVVIPESPEAYIKLTENTLKSSSGRTQQCVLRRHGRVHTACHKLQLKRQLVSAITRARRHSGRVWHHPELKLSLNTRCMLSSRSPDANPNHCVLILTDLFILLPFILQLTRVLLKKCITLMWFYCSDSYFLFFGLCLFGLMHAVIESASSQTSRLHAHGMPTGDASPD